MYKQMITQAALSGGRTHPYGLGLELEEVRGRPVIGHGGSIMGSVGDTVYIPSEDLFVAVLANSNPPPPSAIGIGKRLAALAMNDPYVVLSRAEVDPKTLAPLFGVYRVGEAGATRRFFSRDGKLYTMRDGAKEMEVFPAGGDRFFYDRSMTWFRIERRADGNHVMGMHLNGSKEAEQAVRTGDLPAETAIPAASVAVPRQSAEETAVSFLNAFKTLDTKRFDAFFADDATMFFPEGPFPKERVAGKGPVTAAFHRFFAMAKERGLARLGFEPINMMVQQYPAFAVATFELKGKDNLGRRSIVLRRDGEGWRIVHFHASVVDVPN